MSRRIVFAMWMVGVAGCAGGSSEACPEPCASTQVCCDGRCVFTQIDVNHCGACGSPCSGTCGGGMCTPGVGVDGGPRTDANTVTNNCSPECSSNQRCCGLNCVDRSQTANVDGRPASSMDPRSPFNNCNGCGLRCDPERANSCSIRAGATSPACACGEFGECLAGDVCVQESGRFQCVNLSTNPRNCGELGNSCAEGELCQAGACVCGSTGGRCGEGQACCGGTCIDTSSDPSNCGACGQICTPNAPDCSAGSCTCGAAGRACTAPTAGALGGLGAMPGESCCPGMGCVANTTSSCGCMPCTGSDSCVVGGSGFFGMGGGAEVATVCCGDSFQVALLGCGGFPGIPGFP